MLKCTLFLFNKKNKTSTQDDIIQENFKRAKLFHAIETNSLKEVRFWLQQGVNPDQIIFGSPDGITLLQKAIHNTKLLTSKETKEAGMNIISLLLAEGASPYRKNLLKQDAFYYASPEYVPGILTPEQVSVTSKKIQGLLTQQYPQITSNNIKEISKILTSTKRSSLNKLCNEVLTITASFLFSPAEIDKHDVFIKAIHQRGKSKKKFLPRLIKC